MQPIPYVFFKDNCRDAFAFWADVFRTAPPSLVTADSQIPGADPRLIMHAALKIGEGWIYGSDDFSGDTVAPMAGVSLSISLPDAAEARRVFDALATGGEVREPLAETFFSPAYGALTDAFGVRWMIMADATTAPTNGA